ncbi:SH3 domain-containing protein 19-like isoform X2 [Hylaeus volcanicus]|uniref:SH3 domain-containing protein 19-like isoform X2 n=1 Tax=Hylaeus volcanicus TaxID=313075 RepID=UPI0023B7BA2B|nr:SH3 domain-containing protein 19-like isoform X2 [Hylaeus volcanicus]
MWAFNRDAERSTARNMRIPTRSAPRPPSSSTAQRNSLWSSTNDVFGSTFTQQPIQKKKPPPRPPPPKFNPNYAQAQKEKLKKPARPTELLTNLFGRKRSEHFTTAQFNSQTHNTLLQSENTNGSVCLIDLSPPGSPTFTTRSSSDGVSVDSFGSDGNSNPSAFTSSGNTSQTESAFEDDFDFFGLTTKKVQQNDPWQVNSVLDPFGPLEATNNYNSSQSVKHVGEASFFAYNTNNHFDNKVLSNQANLKVPQSMPTIIRAKPSKAKLLQKSLEQKINHAETDLNSLSKTTVPSSKSMTLDLTHSWPSNSKSSPSPPMPTIPPPAPPSEYLSEVNSDELLVNSEEPHGIALYDFPLTHADDLPFKEGDIIYLIKKVNDDWMEGRIGNRQGIFPINFIDIKVPLPGVPDDVVTAIYSFKGEAPEDLTFNEGEKITVLSRISEDWLYGEYRGRKGQFPVNYVNRVPCNIPLSY